MRVRLWHEAVVANGLIEACNFILESKSLFRPRSSNLSVDVLLDGAWFSELDPDTSSEGFRLAVCSETRCSKLSDLRSELKSSGRKI